MRDFMNMADFFYRRVFYHIFIIKKLRQVAAGYVGVFVYGHAYNGAFLALVPGWIVGSAAKKRNAQGCSGNEHSEFSYIRTYAFHQLIIKSKMKPARGLAYTIVIFLAVLLNV